MSEEPDVILRDEDGVEHRFSLYRIVDVDDVSYALLEPEGTQGEVVVLRVEGSIDSGTLVTLDDEEWERVALALHGQGDLGTE